MRTRRGSKITTSASLPTPSAPLRGYSPNSRAAFELVTSTRRSQRDATAPHALGVQHREQQLQVLDAWPQVLDGVVRGELGRQRPRRVIGAQRVDLRRGQTRPQGLHVGWLAQRWLADESPGSGPSSSSLGEVQVQRPRLDEDGHAARPRLGAHVSARCAKRGARCTPARRSASAMATARCVATTSATTGRLAPKKRKAVWPRSTSRRVAWSTIGRVLAVEHAHQATLARQPNGLEVATDVAVERRAASGRP